MPPRDKRKQAWKRADDDGSSRDDEGVSSPSAAKQKQAWKTADVDVAPSTSKQNQAWKTADDDRSSTTPAAGKQHWAWKAAADNGSSIAPSTSKQNQAWKTADDDGSSITPSTGKQHRAWKAADDDGSSIMPSTVKGNQAWKTADEDGSSGDDRGVSRPSTDKHKRAWEAAHDDGSSIMPPTGKQKVAGAPPRKADKVKGHWSRLGSHGNGPQQRQQREKREPKRTRVAYFHGASLPATSLMAKMPKKTKVTQFDKRAMCPKRVANLFENGRCRCQRNCYQPFTLSEIVSLRQAFHQLHHTEQSFLIQTMRTGAKNKTTYAMNGHIVCVEALHNLIGAGS